jgi:6-phosphogluconolactonase
MWSGEKLRTKLLGGLSLALLLLVSLSMVGNAHAVSTGSVYTEDNASPVNSVLQYQSGPGGVLSLVNTFSADGAGTGSALASQNAVVLTQDGHWLLVVDAGSNQITVFQIGSSGGLTLTDVVGSQGTTPISLTASDNLVYVLNSGTPNIAGFTLSTSGQLAFIAGSNQPLSGIPSSSPEDIGFVSTAQTGPRTEGGPGTSVLIVTEKAAGVIDSYTLSRGGVASAPTVTPSNGGGPYGFTTTSQGYLILTEAGTGTVSSYVVSSAGALRTISGAIPDFGNAGSATGPAPCWVTVSNNGEFAYVSNAHVGSISVYGISGTGILVLDSSIAAHTLVPTLDLAVSGNSQYLYALNGGSITSFQLYPDGSIAQVSSIVLPATASGATGLTAS